MRNLIRRTNVPGTAFYQRDLGDLLDRFFTDSWAKPFDAKEFAALGDWQPKLNLKETEKAFVVQAELPGLTEDQVELIVENDTLYLKGEKKVEKKDEGENYHRVESSYGSFYRTIAFPSKIDAEKVAAELKNGVLTVTVNKAAEVLSGSRKIAIKKM